MAFRKEPFTCGNRCLCSDRHRPIDLGMEYYTVALLGRLVCSQDELAKAGNISIPTTQRLEASDGPLGGRSETNQKIRKALQLAGVEFIDENGGGVGVRLRKRSGAKS